MRYKQLVEFLEQKMRMSHVYQPVMIAELLKSGGRCSEERIARALLQHDVSQVEYYQKITRDMVGQVLRSHDVVSRDRKSKTYALAGFDHLNDSQIADLLARCQAALDEFMEARGSDPWSHRTQGSAYISGTDRYEVLKAAKFRCELCGIAADRKALEVDHIIPRSKGGSNDLSNLQALCYSCNAMKRDRDDTDFREVNRAYEHRANGCIFCALPKERVIAENELALATFDAYPVTPRHALVIPKRHEPSYFELGRPELNACRELLQQVRSLVEAEDPTVTGFNVGVNDGGDAGQTIFHCHIHLIPRRAGDVEQPRGGVRHVIPGKGAY